MDVKSDILGTGKMNQALPEQQTAVRKPITLSPLQKARMDAPLPAPVSPVSEQQKAVGQHEGIKETPKRLSYTEMFQMLNPYEQKTPEEQAKEKKRERSSRIISAIGDGISALSNLYFTTQGAPNAYTGQNTLSAAYKRRHDELNAKRNANHDKWMNGYLNAIQMDDNMNWRDKMQAYRENRDKLGDKRYEDSKKAASAAEQLKYQREITMKEIDHAYQMGVLDARSKRELEKQAVVAKNQKELLALGHKYKLEEIAEGKKDGTKEAGKKKQNLMRFRTPSGTTEYYDMNDDTQVAKMYNEGVRAGYFKEMLGEQPTVERMRDLIIGSTGRKKISNFNINKGDEGGAGPSSDENNESENNQTKDTKSLPGVNTNNRKHLNL